MSSDDVSITVSNQVGLRKPDIRIYQHVGKQFESGQTVVYIDDQEKNLKPVIKLGWKTLLADKEHKWIEKVEPMIRNEDFVGKSRKGPFESFPDDQIADNNEF